MTERGRRYHIVEVLGRGGFGTVYRAEMVAGGVHTSVALKLLHADVPGGELERLRDEARLLSAVRHRALVQVQAMVPLPSGRWAMVMEHVPGVTLQAVRRERPMPVSAALEVIEEVASALDAARVGRDGRNVQLVHRDIKLSNLQLTAAGEVKLLDFGIATTNTGEATTMALKHLVGTRRYMSPERFQGIAEPPSDVFALGVVLALLVDRLPRDALATLTPPEAAEEVSRVGRRVDALPTGCWGVGTLLGEMLDRDPAVRPSAREVAERAAQLRRHCGGPSLRSFAEEVVPNTPPALEPDSWVGRTVEEHTLEGSDLPGVLRRSWLPWAAGAAGLALAMGGAVLASAVLGGGAGVLGSLWMGAPNVEPQAVAPTEWIRTDLTRSGHNDHSPSASPDGRVYWIRDGARIAWAKPGSGDFGQVPVDGDVPGELEWLSVSPDGARVLLGSGERIGWVPQEGGAWRELGEGAFAEWLPSGAEVLVAQSDVEGLARRTRLSRVNLQGERTEIPWTLDLPDYHFPVRWFTPMADGARLAFAVGGRAYLADLATGALSVPTQDESISTLTRRGDQVLAMRLSDGTAYALRDSPIGPSLQRLFKDTWAADAAPIGDGRIAMAVAVVDGRLSSGGVDLGLSNIPTVHPILRRDGRWMYFGEFREDEQGASRRTHRTASVLYEFQTQQRHLLPIPPTSWMDTVVFDASDGLLFADRGVRWLGGGTGEDAVYRYTLPEGPLERVMSLGEDWREVALRDGGFAALGETLVLGTWAETIEEGIQRDTGLRHWLPKSFSPDGEQLFVVHTGTGRGALLQLASLEIRELPEEWSYGRWVDEDRLWLCKHGAAVLWDTEQGELERIEAEDWHLVDVVEAAGRRVVNTYSETSDIVVYSHP